MILRNREGKISANLTGYVSLVQEQRFRLVTEDGKGFLLTLGRNAPLEVPELHRLQKSRTRIRVKYTGEPNTTSAVAHAVEAVTEE